MLCPFPLSKGISGRKKQPPQQYQEWRKSEPLPFPFLKILSCIQVSAKSVLLNIPTPWAKLTTTAGRLWIASPLGLPFCHFPGRVCWASVDIPRHMQLPRILQIAVFLYLHKMPVSWIETCLSLIRGFSKIEFFSEIFVEPRLQHFHTCKLHLKKPDCRHLSDK